MRTLTINSAEFDSLEGFYKSLEPCLRKGECPWGQNLDSLDEIACYKFNYTDDIENDVTKIIWNDFEKSKAEDWGHRGGKPVLDIVVEILGSVDEIEFEK